MRTLFVYRAPQEHAALGELEREGRPLAMRIQVSGLRDRAARIKTHS